MLIKIQYKPPVSHDGTFSYPGPKAVHHQPVNNSWNKSSTNKILLPDLNCNLVLMYLRCFLFSWSNPEVEAIEGGSIQLACSSHTCLKTNPSVCSRQTVMLPQSWTGWKQSHLSKWAAQSLQTPKLLIHKKRIREDWKNLEVIGKLLFCCPSLNESDIHCSPFFILHPKLPWMCWY